MTTSFAGCYEAFRKEAREHPDPDALSLFERAHAVQTGPSRAVFDGLLNDTERDVLASATRISPAAIDRAAYRIVQQIRRGEELARKGQDTDGSFNAKRLTPAERVEFASLGRQFGRADSVNADPLLRRY